MTSPANLGETSNIYNFPGDPPSEHTPPLSPGGPGDTFGGMDRVWEKLAEHDRRFDRFEQKLDRIDGHLASVQAQLWTTAGAIIFFVVTSTLGLLALVYTARQDTTAAMGAALSAIQTVVSARPSEAPPAQPPTVIVVPPTSVPTATIPPKETPPAPQPQP